MFLDANIFLRFFTQSPDPKNQRRSDIAKVLIGAVSRGEVLATTSEVVLHEVAFVLGSKNQYGLKTDEILDCLKFAVRLNGLRFSREDRWCYERALEILESHPRIQFSDAVIAARCEHREHTLATFDKHFSRFDSLQLWRESEFVPEK
jgi:predicted nucleic acid-binding protein